MKGKTLALILGGIVFLLIVTGVVVYKAAFSGPALQSQPTESVIPANLPPADASISVTLTKSAAKANTVVLTVSGLGGKIANLEYQLQYQSKGVVKGVTSGKPIDTSGQDKLSREIYLGTCSKNDCTPDVGVSTVSISMVFTDTAGQKTQYSHDFTL